VNTVQNPAAFGAGMEARFAAAARHSRMVRVLRIAVPAAVLLAMGGIVAVSVFNPFRIACCRSCRLIWEIWWYRAPRLRWNRRTSPASRPTTAL